MLQENTKDLHNQFQLQRFILNLRELPIDLCSNSYKQAVKTNCFTFFLWSSSGFLSYSTVAFMIIKISQALQNIYKVAPVGVFMVL